MKKNKDTAIIEYMEAIKDSWTFERLTSDEISQLYKSIKWAEEQKIIKGNYRQRWETLQAIYRTFLNALNYSPIGWREPLQEDTPF